MKTITALLLAFFSLVGFNAISQEVAASVDRSAEYMAEINYAEYFFIAKQYGLAKTAYTEVEHKYRDKHSRKRIIEIDRFIAPSCRGYHSNCPDAGIIRLADKYYNECNLVKALELYRRAVSIKRSDVHAKQRLSEIKLLILQERNL
ncbi:MAG: hypothetical protein ACI837_001060 [Crocinitomicaceae bacterium]|jgi:hypothetical protein